MRGRAVRDLSGPESGYILLERFPSTHGDRRHEIVTILPLLTGPHSRLDERRGFNLSSVMDVAGTRSGARLLETLRRGGHSSNGFRIPVFPSAMNTDITRALFCAHLAVPRATIRRVADLTAESLQSLRWSASSTDEHGGGKPANPFAGQVPRGYFCGPYALHQAVAHTRRRANGKQCMS